ncbi:hypothetical protein N7522_003743 [Penicillium canescens]|nr:hypothetical protein N7522_003743 [Penicillium canescens]
MHKSLVAAPQSNGPFIEKISPSTGDSESIAEVQYKLIVVVTGLDGCTPTSFFRIVVRLLNGPCLNLDSPLPLNIQVTKLPGLDYDILLSEFQTMLVETTEVRAQGITQKCVKPWIVDSTARINHLIRFEEATVDLVSSMKNHPCFNKRLPSELTSSFEVCNIKRTYKLDVRSPDDDS